MALTATILHQDPVDDVVTLAALATDASLVAGRESTAVSHEDDEIDSLVGGKVVTGTTPTANRQIEIWAYGSYDGISYSGGATGSDANLTPQEKSLMRLLTIIPTSSTSDQVYTWGPFSLQHAFGGTLPRKTGLFFVHNTGVNLKTSGHEVKRTPIKYQSASA